MAQGGQRDRPEGDRGMEEAGGRAFKQASGHRHRGAIVLRRPLLTRAPAGGGQVGTETGRWVEVGD